jgi:two-component system, OmpR family, sensor histidine kinase ResE
VIRNSIVAKLWLTIVAMVVLVLALLSFLLQQFFDNYVYQQQSSTLIRLATNIQASVLNNDLDMGKKISTQLAEASQAKVVIGIPISANSELQSAYNSLSEAQRRSLLDGQPVSVRGEVGGTDTVSVCLIIPSSPRPGMLVVSQRMSILNEPLMRIRNLIYLAMGLGVLLATGLAFVVSKNLSRPLVQMNEVAEEMAKGHFGGQIDVVTSDEVGRLGQTFNALANELASTIAELSKEKDQLSSILSSLQDGVVATDLEGQITLANPPALRWFSSLTLSETGIPDSSKMPKRMLAMFQQVLETRQAVVKEITLLGRYVVVTMTPLYEPGSDHLRGAVIVLRDVTEERRLDRLRKDFLANVSHELRTPLSMMQGYAEALLDEFGDDPVQRRELTEIIHDETLRMKRLVTDLLDLAKLESGQFQMSLQQEDITSIVRKVVRKFHTLAQERGIDLSADLPTGPIYVLGDFDRLEQVFTNLVDNAIRHTNSGGRVTLSVSASVSHAQVRVSDTGSGIPEEDLPYIWERFYKADKARTRGSSGTGLGLAITRHIVLEHKGDIIVESVEGQGTTFTVSIPLFQAPSQ